LSLYKTRESCDPVILSAFCFTGRLAIFDPIHDTRSTRRKIWTGFAGVCVTVVFLAGMALFWQVSALRQFSRQLNAELRKELNHYRIIMIAPRLLPPPRQTPRAPEGAARRLEPLTIPDPRILRGLDPALVDFIGENPEVESVFTREIVRDMDSGTLDVHRLLEESSMQISFGLDRAGHIRWRRIDRSSQVPSLDHLAMELVRLLEKYQLLQVITGVDRVTASIHTDRQIEITLEGQTDSTADVYSIRGRIEAGLVLWRMLLAYDEASFLQDISIVTREHRIRISKSYDKEAVAKLLRQYYQPAPVK